MRCNRRNSEKDGGDGKDAAGSASDREQMGRGEFAKVETAKRRRQSGNEEGDKAAEMHHA